MMNATVYLIKTSLVKKHINEVLNYIEASRRDRALKYLKEEDKLRSLGSSYLMKKYLGDVEIKENKNGKPYIDGGPFFNVSHSGEYSVLAVHPSKEVGVDIERIDPSKLNAIKFTLSEKEKKESKPDILFRMWSNKESLIKCIGSSMNDIKKAPGLPLSGKRIENNECYFTKSLLYKDYSLSITLKESEEFDIVLNEIKIVEI